MRLGAMSRRMVVPILVIGLLAFGLTLACAEDLHSPASGPMDGGCAIMSHSGLGVATVSSDSAITAASELLALGLGLAIMAFMLVSPTRPAAVIAAPSPPPDTRFGRLRL